MDQQSTTSTLKRKAPQLIIIAAALILAAYVILELLADYFITPFMNGDFSFTRTIASLGYGGVFGLMILEASSLPIPSEMILPFAGWCVHLGHMDFGITLAVATTAAVIGSLIDYYIGLKGVQILTKYRILGRAVFSESQLSIAANYFTRYGSIMVFVGRLIPVVRTLISFPAGAVKMNLTKFIIYTTAGCVLWNGLLLLVGYYLGSKWQAVTSFSHYIVIAAVAIAGVLCVLFLLRRKKRLKKAQATQA